jgi:DNA-binding CsgD family transcriptional regulator
MPKPYREDVGAHLSEGFSKPQEFQPDEISGALAQNSDPLATPAETISFFDDFRRDDLRKDDLRSDDLHNNDPRRDPAPVSDGLAMPRDVLLALNYGLELVRCGAMLVRREGQPYFLNRSAAEILKKRDGLMLSRTGLIADRAADTRMLRHLLHEAIATPERGEPQGSPLSLPRKAAHSALIVRVLPGPGLDCWSDQENRAALLTVYDEENSVQVDEAVLRKLYGLTRGEAALATILLKGKSIDEAAEQLFISPHTARTHLKRIFMKTDTHRQTELVIRIFSALS